jgi:chromosome partitioning protein
MREAGNVDASTAGDHKDLVKVIEANQGDHDYIVLDGPPRIAELTRAIMLLSDLSLIPVGASAAEIWATSDMLPIIEQAKALKPDLNIRTVWMRYRGYTRAAKEISRSAGRELGLKALKTKLGFRVAYSDALAAGLTVAESTDKNAKAEIQSITREILRLLKP